MTTLSAMHCTSLFLFSLVGLVVGSRVATGAEPVRITVDTSTTYQTIDGFGFSEAFQRANGIVDLPEPQRSQLIDLLFNATSGAGFTIVRNGIGSSPNSTNDWMNTIEPQGPRHPDETPAYVWDSKDSGQLWVCQQAAKYGVKTFYADAWSAPGFMKNNSNDAQGGFLCGSPGANCSTGDWRQAYADYLVKNVQLYRAHGINITHLGFLNEPDYKTAYASMQMDGHQAADFIKVLHPTLKANNLSESVHITCCDATGWATQRNMTRELVADGAEPLVGVISSHLYTSRMDAPLSSVTSRKVWMTEYADLGGHWSTAWFSANASRFNDTKAMAGDGLTWAHNIHTGLTTGNLSAYLWWVATQDTATNGNNNEKLVLVDNTNNTYTVAKRLWAFAHFSRAARPGAVRVSSSASASASSVGNMSESVDGLHTTAFHNLDGSLSVVAINDGAEDTPVAVETSIQGGSVQAWVTDEARDMDSVAATAGANGSIGLLTVPAHGMLSVVVRPSKT